MRRAATKWYPLVVLIVLSSLMASCNEINKGAPVQLIATTKANVLVYDLSDPACGANGLGTVTIRSNILTKTEDTRFLDVRLRSYRVSYQRTDGGKLVPQSFVRTIDDVIGAGSSGSLNDLLVFEPLAATQAPFAALYPNNGGVDPETGKRFITMDIVIEIFGETLAGDNVSTTTRQPITFCVGCGCVQSST